ncbi:phosphoribosyltransferase family protein [Collinsella sp. An2]|uniref:ComF family protein n=1 Tax=Collinsella sp. An2 TaxID=1965585 RepID=UPI001EF668EE|nr:phosphoribosyltransferase family protein [Collinsella sp. An2]
MFVQQVGHLVAEVLSPTRCAGCERPGALLCDRCLAALVPIDPRHACLRCGASHGDVLCTECATGDRALGVGTQEGAGRGECTEDRDRASPDRCLAAACFDGPLPRVIRTYKDAGERRLAPVLAELLWDAACHAEQVAPERYGGLVSQAQGVVFVPATAAAFKRRGFDHMEAIAREFACLADVPLCDALAKHGAGDQRKLGRADRLAGSRDLYQVVDDVQDKDLLLLDDVVTTGATMSAAAGALRDAGARRVDALALARVW